ncbi:hypothetical protein A3D66_01080 [Candidatus Kaiserbacteria bacterium RIFCSPHIGHO2_02_FULL_50_9]|uniref:NADPH-dependent FMN reductase-like domain-containing protein n=1 Tax=Candidatus Kaiserbacteria bacterium RIFCSPLOWO2_01_FULL_51_21 TaxID=1798508 RepID=A0A1F6ED08_9BACT|nr:MAG: hypothetical protein A2761_01875 [Candidatus Kaiserbacteria bacterium RIFCSPHIGHO2_01_FULL_51_33]OGG63245.1 MAG: hypothetical protein A3D66_01080 [Candidatus Kaiserbacteria bacterium RIFCSPHIGHO2_02_FULL_50_9]OGG71549.1 MAG: hypothetical protein A3A35_00175 [Candidatus Kaiserbacteria bacterium RIFCSPLOWO2_01_FULL_51_21]
MKTLGILGSLRKDSLNRKLLNAVVKLAPEGMEVEIYDRLGKFPIFNDDLTHNPPEVVKEFKQKVRGVDALLFVSPEYNYSIPGGLKNAIDWGSRPPRDNCFDGKPAAIMGVAGRLGGTMRMQYHLRQVMVTLNMYPINKELFVREGALKFDAAGTLRDEPTRKAVEEELAALKVWTEKLSKQ